MELLGDMGDVDSCFGLFGDGVGVVQDSCTVCTKHTIGTGIIFDAPDGTPS
jgi:hypothetical protein